MQSEKQKIFSIGVYGFKEDQFFKKLIDFKIDILLDIRQRRGIRGKEYAFANSKYLQRKLVSFEIEYVHAKELSPSDKTRNIQKAADISTDVFKRYREYLNNNFIQAYTDECLSPENLLAITKIIKYSKNIVLLCVERSPSACHRSIATQWLASKINAEITHLTP